ncbi:hypothetical protein AB0873_11195 [Micromonospora sp. NPDC047707]|uniref:hypothetical protein n=1 Tax=Micromonospora sp. NPDC047707 TaxID=3154498 RepID=UPI0034527A75
MGFELLPALVAGIVGGAVMSLMMAGMRRAGLTPMDISLIEGTMLTGRRELAVVLGLLMHLVVFSGLVIGSTYAGLFTWWNVDDSDGWWVGGLIGVPHALIGGLALALLPAIHPRMGAGSGGRDGLRVAPPGIFGRNYGAATVSGFFVVHVVYGAVFGAFYGWFMGGG